MAVPKKRTGHSAQGKRRSNWKATKPTLTTCPNCGQKMLAHTVCTACGQYKGKVVSRKSEGFVEASEVKAAKKAPAKKTTKKTASKKAEKPVEEVKETDVVAETKAEAVEETPAEENKEEKTEE